jgi:pyruvate,water dikinase
MQLPELRRHLAASIDKAATAFAITLEAAEPMFHGVEQLYSFCEEELGAEGVALAGASIQGYANLSSQSEVALFDLALLARELDLDGIFLKTGAADLEASIRHEKRGPRFLAALGAAMDRFGWRAPGWFELSLPSWRENHGVPLGLIRGYLDDACADPRLALAKAARGRRGALRRVRGALAAKKLSRFEDLWRTARQFVPVSEARALWQLSLGGFLRVPALALGRRLTEAGALTSPEDVFYLTLAEVEAGGEVDIAARRAERDRWLSAVPPLTLGRSPAPPPASDGAAPSAPPALPFGARMISGFSFERSDDARVLKGQPASPGLATGRARVLQTVDEAARVEPGDILVCRFTTPAWSHLFSRVSAIVADSGGVLSHCAILAREYSIPCVPGVRNGTRRIRDGMILTVDGTQGIVRIED